MKETARLAWLDANQRFLAASLAPIRQALLRAGAGATVDSAEPPGPDNTSPGADLSRMAEAMAAPPALDLVCETFSLSEFERGLLLLCAGIELDSSFAPLCAAAQGDERRAFPTFSLALSLLPYAHWSAITPAGPLRRWRLIEIDPRESVTSSRLRIDESVLHYLTGIQYVDPRLQGLLEFVLPAGLAPSHESIAMRIEQIWSKAYPLDSPSRRPVIQLCGPAKGGKRAVAAAVGKRLGLRVFSMRAAHLPASSGDRESLARLWERQALLGGCALLLDCEETGPEETARAAVPFLESVQGLVMVTARDPVDVENRSSMRIDVPKPAVSERRILWQTALGTEAEKMNGSLEALAAQFHLDPEKIGQACARMAADSNGAGIDRFLWEACREQSRSGLEALAQRIESEAGWEDLVLPDMQRRILLDIAAHMRRRFTVTESWGFAAKSSRGLGTNALFHGLSGTGKTLAAEVLANELSLDLYRVDLSQAVSKYIGETEKNLKRIFEAAEESGAILLFDEADALFGKRSEVRDSHDRYANIEVSYLLQRTETYRGLAILTTNMKDALDASFLRRIRFVVQFPFPAAQQRAEIWRRIFPSRAPVDGLDLQKLSRLNVAGGSIGNIALHAAYFAADEGSPVRMSHVLRAARHEYAKLEKPLSDLEIAGWG